MNPQYEGDVDDRLNVGEIVGNRLGLRLGLRIDGKGRGFLRTAEGDAEGGKSDDGGFDGCDVDTGGETEGKDEVLGAFVFLFCGNALGRC